MARSDVTNIAALPNLAQNEKAAVQEFAKRLRRQFGSGVRDIILLGSKATGPGQKDSDIDILILLTSLSWETKKAISEMAAQENIKYDVLISTVRYDAKTWDSPVIRSSPFGHTVREQGLWL